MPGGKKVRDKGKGPQNVRGAVETTNQGTSQESSETTFQRELTWCIEQLQCGLLAKKSKTPTGQTQDAVRVLKVLSNPDTPYPKKRQFMRASFGDYRKKMDEESKRYAARAKKISLKSVPPSNQKSTFIKKSSLSTISSSSNEFCFNFTPSAEQSTSKAETTSCLDKGDDTEQPQPIPINSPDDQAMAVTENCFKMQTSNNSFQFDFSVEDT